MGHFTGGTGTEGLPDLLGAELAGWRKTHQFLLASMVSSAFRLAEPGCPRAALSPGYEGAARNPVYFY